MIICICAPRSVVGCRVSPGGLLGHSSPQSICTVVTAVAALRETEGGETTRPSACYTLQHCSPCRIEGSRQVPGFAGEPGLEGKRPVRRSTSVGKPSAIRPEVVLLPWGSFH